MIPIENDETCHKQSYIGGRVQVDGHGPLGFGTVD
jgi:hypothetical protein